MPVAFVNADFDSPAGNLGPWQSFQSGDAVNVLTADGGDGIGGSYCARCVVGGLSGHAPDPISQTWVASPGGTFFPFFPLALGVSNIVATETITYAGNVDAPPVWTVQGPASSIVLTNTTTGESLTLVVPTLGGSSSALLPDPGLYPSPTLFPGGATWTPVFPITIDAGAGIITDAVGHDLTPWLSPGSTFWSLVPGANLISVNVEGTADLAQFATNTITINQDVFTGLILCAETLDAGFSATGGTLQVESPAGAAPVTVTYTSATQGVGLGAFHGCTVASGSLDINPSALIESPIASSLTLTYTTEWFGDGGMWAPLPFLSIPGHTYTFTVQAAGALGGEQLSITVNDPTHPIAMFGLTTSYEPYTLTWTATEAAIQQVYLLVAAPDPDVLVFFPFFPLRLGLRPPSSTVFFDDVGISVQQFCADVTIYIDALGNYTPLFSPFGDGVDLDGASGRFMPPITTLETQTPGQPGSRLDELQIDPRDMVIPVLITGTCDPDCSPAAMSTRQALRAFVAGLNPLKGPGQLIVTAPDGTQRQAAALYTGGLTLNESWYQTRTTLVQMAVLTFRAFDPWWRDLAPVTETFGLASSARFFPFFPLKLGASAVTTTEVIEYEGDVATSPLWVIDGPCESVILTNVTTGKTLILDMTIDAGDTINIDTRLGSTSIVQGEGGANLFGMLDPSSSFWPLAPGPNEIEVILTGAVAGQSSITLSYTNAWLSA